MAFDYRAYAFQAAQRAGIANPEIFVRQINAESGFRPDARSPAGALGIAQIMPGTARGWGVDPLDPKASLDAAANAMAKYLRSYKGDWAKALAAYNAGVGAVAKYGGVPPYAETRNYIKKILNGSNPSEPVRAYAPTTTPTETSSSSWRDDKFLQNYLKGSSWEPFLDFMESVSYFPANRAQADGAGPNVQTGSGVPARRKGEKGYQYLQRLGQTLFGLKNDPGDSQTTGGRHAKGSRHYAGQAVDFGDARNSRQQLQAWHDYLDRNREALGLAELLWQVPGHYNHVHAATARSSKGIKKR
jgi:hypothetical protein